MSTKHKHYDLILAWANGAEIQVYNKAISSWEDNIYPVWSFQSEYRIKPKPKVKKWRWVNSSKEENNYIGVSHGYYASAEDFNSDWPKHIAIQKVDSTMIEVEE